MIRRSLNAIHKHGLLGAIRLVPRALRVRFFYRNRSGLDWDRTNGVDTEGVVHASHINAKGWKEACNYQPVTTTGFGSLVAHVLPCIDPADYTFVDIGSGKGRAILLASSWPWKRIIGVEISPELHALAERNIQNYRGQLTTRPESICVDATQFEVIKDPLVLFFYQPFSDGVTSRVLENIRESYTSFHRDIWAIYTGPHGHGGHAFERSGFLHLRESGENFGIWRARGSDIEHPERI